MGQFDTGRCVLLRQDKKGGPSGPPPEKAEDEWNDIYLGLHSPQCKYKHREAAMQGFERFVYIYPGSECLP
ncbi:hypothetical protein Gbfr_001_058 [Gluconobacter frateurii M-2]|nr:hypothetical protein Gbfr_001_058 [Gluconobacter frateurii M-2]